MSGSNFRFLTYLVGPHVGRRQMCTSNTLMVSFLVDKQHFGLGPIFI